MSFFKKPSFSLLRSLLLTTLVGLVTGGLGAFVLWTLLLSYQASSFFGSTNAPLAERRRPLLAEEKLLADLRYEISPSLAELFLESSQIEGRFFPSQAIGYGVVLTSDGWILSHRTVIDPRAIASLRVGLGTRLLPVIEALEDKETGVLFLKIETANLRPAVFGASQNLKSGEAVYLPLPHQEVLAARVRNPGARSELVALSDRLDSRLTLDAELLTKAGAPLVNAEGEIIALTLGEDNRITEAIPMDHLAPIIRSFLKEGVFLRPALGVRGMHLEGSRSASQNRERGFLVLAEDRGSNRKELSPAFRAGLQPQDIVIKLQDTIINGSRDLSELLLAWNPQDTVDLTILRAEEELIIPVTLGQRSSEIRY